VSPDGPCIRFSQRCDTGEEVRRSLRSVGVSTAGRSGSQDSLSTSKSERERVDTSGARCSTRLLGIMICSQRSELTLTSGRSPGQMAPIWIQMSSTATTNPPRRRIDELAESEGVTMAEIIRRAVDGYLDDQAEPELALIAHIRCRPGLLGSFARRMGPWLTSWSTLMSSWTIFGVRGVSRRSHIGSTIQLSQGPNCSPGTPPPSL